jgi:hypothetical protein
MIKPFREDVMKSTAQVLSALGLVVIAIGCGDSLPHAQSTNNPICPVNGTGVGWPSSG